MIIYIAGNGGAKGPVGRAIEKMILTKSGHRLFSYWWINPNSSPNFYHNFIFWKRKITKVFNQDKLFRITSKHFTAGAVYKDSICISCAPILCKHLLGKNIKAMYAVKWWVVKEIN